MTNTNTTTNTRRRTARTVLAAGIAALALAALSGCVASSAGQTPTTETGTDKPSIMWIGDSIASNEAPALRAAFRAAGADFIDESANGGGMVVDSGGEMSELFQSVWEGIEKAIDTKKPDTVVYQISSYDWGTPEQQKEGYQKLADEAQSVGADLVIVSTPPVKIDEFYAPHAAEMATTSASAQSIADANADDVTFLDASALWGTDANDAKAQRGNDGIHACQQASAEFAVWFTQQFEEISGLKAADPTTWATGDWTAAETYSQMDCPTGKQ